jgi:elongator complex protein 3
VEKIFNIEKKAHELGKTKTPTNSEILILFENRLKENLEKNLTNERIKELRQLLKRLKVRSNSGVAVVSLLTKPYACPGKCIYCPTEVKMPKSYLSKEPAAARALANNFDPYKQMVSRLRALEMNGHPIDKLEIIVIGGTFDYYKKDYQEFFISEIFRAANEYSVPTLTLPEVEVKTQNKNIFNFENIANYGIAPPSGELRFSVRGTELNELQHQNETANCRIIGLSTETRPDYINFENLN